MHFGRDLNALSTMRNISLAKYCTSALLRDLTAFLLYIERVLKFEDLRFKGARIQADRFYLYESSLQPNKRVASIEHAIDHGGQRIRTYHKPRSCFEHQENSGKRGRILDRVGLRLAMSRKGAMGRNQVSACTAARTGHVKFPSVIIHFSLFLSFA